MAYLSNATTTIDAILTKRGRELLSQGKELNITQFACSDDEIDYSLWNAAHSLGSNYYGIIIENMPVLEAVADETLMMKYKLVTLPKDTIYLPSITVLPTSYNLSINRSEYPINVTLQPATSRGSNDTLGYTATLANTRVADINVSTPIPSLVGEGVEAATVRTLGDVLVSKALVGMSFIVRAKNVATTTSTTVTVSGNETGGQVVITITVYPPVVGGGGTVVTGGRGLA